MVRYSPASCIWQLFLGVWVLLVEYGTLDFSGDDFVRGAMLGLTVDTGLATVLGFGRISHIFYVDVGSDFGVFLSRRMEKYAQSMLRFESSPLEYRHYFCESMCWILRDDVGHFPRSVRIFRTSQLGVESLVVMPINSQRLLTKTLCLEAYGVMLLPLHSNRIDCCLSLSCTGDTMDTEQSRKARKRLVDNCAFLVEIARFTEQHASKQPPRNSRKHFVSKYPLH